MAKYFRASYHKLLLASIDQVKGLATSAALELNKNQCVLLSQGLQATAQFLQRKDVKKLISRYSSPLGSHSSRSNALLQLFFVVKQAENLVRQCCNSNHSTWPQRALTLFAMKDDVLDILVHLRWWTSIFSMVIDIPSSKLSIPERLKRANQEFEQGLQSNSELQNAAEEDEKLLLNNVTVQMQAADQVKSKPGSRKRHGANYLRLLQAVHALLTERDEHSTRELNEYTHDRPNSLVGQGSFGVVHKVKWCGYGCVLKQYQNLKSDDMEVKSLRRLHHPHIVRFFRYWKDENIERYKSHILMERMEKNLVEHIESEQRKSRQTRPFSEPVAIDIMLQVVNAIWHMHNKDIVHRDLKPQNVLVRSGGINAALPDELSAEGYVQVKLGDFGLAKEDMLTSHSGHLTHKSGTTLYRAPELSLREYTDGTGKNFPRKIDMWSFGIMCSQILTGERPFQIIEGNALQAHIGKGGRPSIPDDCPDYLRFCMESCWEYDPKKRPRSLDLWRMLRLAQLRSLGIIDQNYELFTFKDHSNKHALQLAPAIPQGVGLRVDRPLVAVNQESVPFTKAARPPFVCHDSLNTQGLLGLLQGSLFNNVR